MANWLDKHEQGGLVLKKKTKDNYGKKINPNDVKASVGPNFVGLGYDTTGRKYSPAWGGQFQMGGSLPGAVGHIYARYNQGGYMPGDVDYNAPRKTGSAPSNGKYAKKTKASAQNGQEMKFYQEGLDFVPKSISQNGSVIKDDRGQWAHPGEITEIGSNEITMQGVDYPVLGISDTGDTQMMYPDQDYKFDGEKVTEYPMAQNGWLSKYEQQPQALSKSDIEKRLSLEKNIKDQKARNAQPTISQYTPKAGDQEGMNAARDAYRAEEAKPLNRAASSKYAANAMENIVEPMVNIEMAMGAGQLLKPVAKAAGKYLTEQTALKNAYKLNPYAFKPNSVSSSVDDVGRGLTRNTNELPPPPHEIILNEHAINLERLTPKNKRKMISFDDSDIGSGLTLRNNPSRVKNTEDILGTTRSIKSVKDKKTGESIDLKTWKDDDGQLYYYMSANMPSSKIKAGKAYLEIEKHIPKGASLLENSSLSYDSFLNILKQTKNPKFETFVKGNVPMNNAAKNAAFKTKPRETAPLVEFANKNHADDAVNELNLLLDKYNLPKATVTNEYGNYSIQLPNIGLKKLYSIIGIGGAGALGVEPLEQKKDGGWLNKWK